MINEKPLPFQGKGLRVCTPLWLRSRPYSYG